jgi:membrane-associated phospholipid phosphatase
MIHPHFNLQFVEFLADHRTLWLTRFFLLASTVGQANSYILLMLLLYVTWDKRLAIRLIVLVLVSSSFNSILKVFIKNPRPFVAGGNYREKWAVSPAQAKVLAAEYSTPSAHAMGAAAFYSYFFALTRNRALRILFVVAIVCIGASRPYLGVHYGEDILIGWAIGLLMALAAIAFADRLADLWAKIPYGIQVMIAVAASVAVWSLTAALNGHIDSQVQQQDAFWGFLTAIVIACPLEARYVNFDPRSGGAVATLLRCIVCVAAMDLVHFPLQFALAPLLRQPSALGCAIDYLHYVAAGVAGIFLGPVIFSKMGLAEAKSPGAPDSFRSRA